MSQTLTTILELIGIVLAVIGAWMRWGESVGLMVSGAACVLVGSLAAR